MSHNQDRLDRLVAQLVDSCDNPGSPLWLDALRQRFTDIAQATGGTHVIIEVALTGREPFRIGILTDGELLYPMGRRDPWDVRLQGDPAEVARFVLGEATLLDAQHQGILVLASPSTSRMVGRLRRVVGRELRRLLEDSAAVVLGVRRPIDRLRDLAPSVPQVAFAADCTARALIAACAILTPAAASTYVSTTAGSSPAPPAAAEPVQTPQAAESVTAEPGIEHRPAAIGPAPSAAQLGRATAARTGVDTTASRPGGETRHSTFIEVDCEHSVGRTICAVTDQLAPIVPTGAPGMERRS
jgi:hypothetical protein